MADEAINDMTQGDLVDFAPEKLDRLLSASDLERNRMIIEKQFSSDTFGDSLICIYDVILNGGNLKANFLDTTAVLNQFIDPRRFHLGSI
mgnify:FL=1